MKFKIHGDNKRFRESLRNSIQHQMFVILISEFIMEELPTSAQEAQRREVLGISLTATDIVATMMTELALELHAKLIIKGKSQPIESMIGTFASVISNGDKSEARILATHLVASELILFLAFHKVHKIIKLQKTLNDRFICTYSFYDDKAEDQALLFQLPTSEPTKHHRALGRVRWNPTSTKIVDKQNAIACTILDIPEVERPKPGKNTSQADIELWKKQQIRKIVGADMIGQPIYFDWNMDTRYRLYPSGYHFNPQGNEYEKNIIAFYEPEKVGIVGRQSIKRSIAIAFGKDKLLDEDKIKWYEENKDNLDLSTAKEPTHAKAQMMSLHLANTTGMTNIPVERDATNSQVQIMAVLTGDANIAQLCNVLTDNTEIQDFYGIVAEKLNELTGLKFNRNQLKKTSMIDGYGAGRKLLEQQLAEDTGDLYFDGLVDVYFAALESISPIFKLLKDTMASLWDNKRTRYQWTLPNGNVTDYNTISTNEIVLKPYGLMTINMLASYISPTNKSTGLLVNIIHSVDAYICAEVIRRCKFPVITIHDAFRCHPNHATEMQRIFTEILAEIADSRLLEDIMQEISGRPIPTFNKQFSGEDVLNSKYSIC